MHSVSSGQRGLLICGARYEVETNWSTYENTHHGLLLFVVYHRMRNYLPDWNRCSSIFLTMKRLVSRNLSTQFARQLSSPRENLVDGVPVMHLRDGELVITV